MALIIDGTTVPDTGAVIFNGTSLTSVVCDGKEVWHKMNKVQTVDITIQVSYGTALSNGTREHVIKVTSSAVMQVGLNVNVIASINNSMGPNTITIPAGSSGEQKIITADADHNITWANTTFASDGYTTTTSGQPTSQTTVLPDSGISATRKHTVTILKAA